jgi:hypothetical protein
MDLFSGCDGYMQDAHIKKIRGTFMSQSSFILVVAILVVPITAIYVAFFSVG